MDKENVLTVSQVSSLIKGTLEGAFNHVLIKGEISGFLHHASGHMYFGLKDLQAVIDCVCWRSQVSHLSMKPEDGLEVVCVGRVTTYAGRSKYQLMIQDVRLEGVGAILKMLEERKKKLEAEGLFDAAKKKSLPKYPKHIAVLTSPTGAVIRDIVHRVKERYPCRITVWPCVVQGNGTVQSVTQSLDAIESLEGKNRPDVIIVARGGGSVEDLLPFSDEEIVRAVFRSSIPVISAVGHETDTTLIDFVADQRAPTPTGAAEIATPDRHNLLVRLAEMEARSTHYIQRYLMERKAWVEGCYVTENRVIESKWLRLDDLSSRICSSMELKRVRLQNKVQALDVQSFYRLFHAKCGQRSTDIQSVCEKMQWLVKHYVLDLKKDLKSQIDLILRVSPESVFKRGYVMLSRGPKVVRKTADLKRGDLLQVTLIDGKRDVRVE